MTSVERVQRIIEAAELDVLVATATDGSKLDMVEGNVRDLQAAVALMDESFEGPFYIEGSRSAMRGKSGRRTADDKPFRWKMAGIAKVNAATAAQVRTETVKVPDVESIRKASDAHADARIAEHERQRAEDEAAELRAKVKDLELQLGVMDAVEDDDDDDDTMEGAPLPWYADEEKTLRMMGAFRDLIGGITGKAAPAVPKTEGVSDDERQLLQAFRKFKAARPEDAEQTKSALLANFGEQQKSDEQQ